jgi:hypothetical protein
MLNVFRYVALAIMVFATGEAAMNLYGVAAALFPDKEKEAGQGDERDDSGTNDAKSGDAEPKENGPSAFAKFKEFVLSIVAAVSHPLLDFCFGAILFLLVRIARDQAHDLATE